MYGVSYLSLFRGFVNSARDVWVKQTSFDRIMSLKQACIRETVMCRCKDELSCTCMPQYASNQKIFDALHGLITQRITIQIFTALKTSNVMFPLLDIHMVQRFAA
jgi:hypothetical protein